MSGKFRVGFDASASGITAVTVLEEVNGVWTVVDHKTINLKRKEDLMGLNVENVLIQEFAGCIAAGHYYTYQVHPNGLSYTLSHVMHRDGGYLVTKVEIDPRFIETSVDPTNTFRQVCRQLKERAHSGNLEPGQPDVTWVLKMKELLDGG